MNTIILIGLSLVIALVAIVAVVSRQQTKSLQSRGLLPEPGQIPTMEHVTRLAAAGQKIQAIKMYREINRVGLKEAKDAVEKMSLR
jgi:ribosomal protein L7/L12